MRNVIITGALGAVILILLIVEYPQTMLSPGELTQGHQNLSQQCFSCHQAFGGIKNDRCIACHELSHIGKDSLGIFNDGSFDEKVLFHAQLGKYSCTSCHKDHAGMEREFATTGFEHDILPEPIISDCITCHHSPENELHRQLTNACAKCHTTDSWEKEMVFDHDMIEANNRVNCIGCHQDPKDELHQQLTDACAKCHSTDSWKLERAFDHDMVKPANRNNCVSCHETPADAFHRSVNSECTKCHSTSKWIPSTFDHSAYFVLDNDHNATCATCHLSNVYTTYTCYGCHEHTVNNILQEHREEGITNITDCISCHKSSEEHEGGEGDRKKGNDRHEDDDD